MGYSHIVVRSETARVIRGLAEKHNAKIVDVVEDMVQEYVGKEGGKTEQGSVPGGLSAGEIDELRAAKEGVARTSVGITKYGAALLDLVSKKTGQYKYKLIEQYAFAHLRAFAKGDRTLEL